MTTSRRLSCDDLFGLSATNLDAFTETYHLGFYGEYLAKFPALALALESPGGALGGGRAVAYLLGKAEGAGEDWRGHISAVTVAAAARRQGLARRLVREAERVAAACYAAFFVDLFVRVTNAAALRMYAALGYAVFRRILGYYGAAPAGAGGAGAGAEDAFDMRAPCARNAVRRRDATVPLPRPVRPHEMWPTT